MPPNNFFQMNRNIFTLIISVTTLIATSCKDDDETPSRHHGEVNTAISSTTIEANLFVKTAMTEYYYWYNLMPDVNYKTQPSTEAYFDTLLYAKDRFSYIVSDADAYFAEESGISTSIGVDLTFMYADNTRKHIVASVNYIYHNTPAETAGLKRGDYICTIDGEAMTPSNYHKLLSKTTATYGIRRFLSETDDATDLSFKITATTIHTSPLAEHTIFNVDEHKIAYLLYMDYYKEFNDDMTAIFEEFKAAGATDLILDLRYNQGGSNAALVNLCSLIAPQADVAAGKELMHLKFNDKLDKQGYTDSSTDYFDAELADKSLDLHSVVFITGQRTYSASEATMLDLAPYMQTYKIGETTGGKNTSMFVITPDWYTYANDHSKRFFSTNIDNYVLLPIVATYFNSLGETFDTEDGDGMAPDFEINEYAYRLRGTLGQPDEPLTAAAVEYITTGAITTNKALHVAPQRLPLPASTGRLVIDPSSRIGKIAVDKD